MTQAPVSSVGSAVAASKQFGSDTSKTLVTNQKEYVKSTLPSKGKASGVDWDAWKAKTLQKMNEKSEAANQKIVDHVAQKGESLPADQQQTYATAMSPILNGLESLYGDIVNELEKVFDVIINDLEKAVEAIENWASDAVKSVEDFFGL